MANFIGNEGSKFNLPNCIHMPAKIGAKITTNIGLASCNQPIGITYPRILRSVNSLANRLNELPD